MDDNHCMHWAIKAAEESPDPNTKVGAVLVTAQGMVQVVGFNHIPVGLDDDEIIWNDRDLKWQRVIHAEMACLVNSDIDQTRGATMYVTHPPCDRCMVHLIAAGVEEVVTLRKNCHQKLSWTDSARDAYNMSQEAGINYRHV